MDKKYISYILFALIFYLLFDISSVSKKNDRTLFKRIQTLESRTTFLPPHEQWLNPLDTGFSLHMSNAGFYIVSCDNVKNYGDNKYELTLNICNLQSIYMKNVKIKIFTQTNSVNEYILAELPPGILKKQKIIIPKQESGTAFRVELVATSLRSSQ